MTINYLSLKNTRTFLNICNTNLLVVNTIRPNKLNKICAIR